MYDDVQQEVKLSRPGYVGIEASFFSGNNCMESPFATVYNHRKINHGFESPAVSGISLSLS